MACVQITYLCRDEVHVYRGKVRNWIQSESSVKLTRAQSDTHKDQGEDCGIDRTGHDSHFPHYA